MRIRIVRNGVFRQGAQPLPIGTELDVPENFAAWPGKWEIVEETKGKTLEVASPSVQEEVEPENHSLREAYAGVFGRNPPANMKPENIQKKLQEAQT